MKRLSVKDPKFIHALLLTVGFAAMVVPRFVSLAWGDGLATAIWLFAFLYLAVNRNSARAQFLNGIVFCVGYVLKFYNAIGIVWISTLIFLFVGGILYAILYAYSRVIRKWNRFFVTLAFPVIWMAAYLLATVLRLPSALRLDMMFVDMNVLTQVESVVSSFGLFFGILWVIALTEFAVRNRRRGPAWLAVGLWLLAVGFGIVRLYPNLSAGETVRVAYTTGPYVGDFINYESIPTEDSIASMRASAETAARKGAEILAFNEEAFEIADTEKEAFLNACADAARENELHMLVGMDVDNTGDGKGVNELVWLAPNGEILGSYAKEKLIPILEADYEKGDGVIPTLELDLNGKKLKVSYLICYDSNFPIYVGGIPNDTDILFLPSWDWDGVTRIHYKLINTLAVENGVTVVKPTYDGISTVVLPDGQPLIVTNTNEVGFESVQTADVPIRGEKGFTVVKNEKSPYIYSIISVEVMSILVCLMLLYGSLFENREKTPRSRIYTILLGTCVVALGSDALSWVLDGCLRLVPVLYLTTFLSLAASYVMTGEFIAYLTEYIKERKNISTFLLRADMAFTLLAIAITAVTSLNGTLFSFENAVYSDGPLYNLYIFANVCTMIFALIFTIVYWDLLSVHDRIAAFLYVCIPSVPALINMLIPEFSYTYPASTLSLLILYVMIQSERAGRLKEAGEISTQHALHDELTGLFNRRAFEERVYPLAEEDLSAGVIYADVNGLKYTNDHFGHAAGDGLLQRFAVILCSHFRREEIYRVSGDEFIILLPELKQEVFEERLHELDASLNLDGKKMACIGAYYGSTRDIDKLIKTAETRMYEHKEEFHRQHPELAR